MQNCRFNGTLVTFAVVMSGNSNSQGLQAARKSLMLQRDSLVPRRTSNLCFHFAVYMQLAHFNSEIRIHHPRSPPGHVLDRFFRIKPREKSLSFFRVLSDYPPRQSPLSIPLSHESKKKYHSSCTSGLRADIRELYGVRSCIPAVKIIHFLMEKDATCSLRYTSAGVWTCKYQSPSPAQRHEQGLLLALVQ